MEDCLRFNFSGARYDTKEVILRTGTDIAPFIRTIQSFYGHSVNTRPQSSNTIKVTFRNVPLNVPDEEVINLCSFYGKPVNNKVTYETLISPRMAESLKWKCLPVRSLRISIGWKAPFLVTKAAGLLFSTLVKNDSVPTVFRLGLKVAEHKVKAKFAKKWEPKCAKC